MITGNEAIVLGALRAGIKLAAGYPGTPSSGALESLLKMDLEEGRRVEWSTNEKVALEIAAGVAWSGQRALCTMKMSGVNVCYDSLISIAYSGFPGALVVYVADDPGMSAGMCEQDSRGFAIMSDMPMLEPASVVEAYDLIQVAFDLSEQTGTPVFVRLVTGISNSFAPVRVDEPIPPPDRAVFLEKDINKYTKAGAAIGAAQHRDLIARLARAGQIIDEMGLNRLHLAEKAGGLGIISAGAVSAYLEEGFKIAARFGFDQDKVSVLRVTASHPFPSKVRELLHHSDTILILEELEPHIERSVYVEACRLGFKGRIVGKLDGDQDQAVLSRLGEYGVEQVVQGIGEALSLPIPDDLFLGKQDAEALAADRPIACCPGCPHMGTYMAIKKALRKLRLKKDSVMVTGDIGCTILGMNPPFHVIWNEISMGASVSLAQGYVHAGIKTPVIATIGDSTFFHGGIPGLVNAIQYQVDMTLIIMDNGWTAMTGMQVNPGTANSFQLAGNRQVDLAKLVEGLGVEHFFIVDPFKLDEYVATLTRALTLPGVKVILSRQECAIQAQRRGLEAGTVRVIPENCNLCRLCIIETGCPAIELGEQTISIDESLCYGCGLCAQVCNLNAIKIERKVN